VAQAELGVLAKVSLENLHGAHQRTAEQKELKIVLKADVQGRPRRSRPR
jgi:hypothetical protein